MYFPHFKPYGVRSEAAFVRARKKIGSLCAGDGGQAPASGSGREGGRIRNFTGSASR